MEQGGRQTRVPGGSRGGRSSGRVGRAAFHLATIEQGGSSLYTTTSTKVSNLEVLRIVVSIGGTEVNHFAVWQDTAGDVVAQPLAPLSDPETGVTFPDLNALNSPLFRFLTAMGLFTGQSTAFFDTLSGLATAADAAQRHG